MKCHHTNIHYIHPDDSLEIKDSNSFNDYIDIFNDCEYFISYDPLSYLQIISVLCGCICIVYPLEDVNKEDWYKKTALYEYMIENDLKDIAGISYGNTPVEIERARNTVSLLKDQLFQINQWFLEKKVKSFINDIQYWEKNSNSIKNIYIYKQYRKMYDLDTIFYRNFYPELKSRLHNKQQTISHYNNIGVYNGSFACEKQFFDTYPEFNVDFYNEFHSDIKACNMNKFQLMYHYHSQGKNEDRITSKKHFENVYPEFNLDFYNEFHYDLKKCNMNHFELMKHYHLSGKNEGRIVNENQFQNLYPDLDLEFYNEFHPDLKECKFTRPMLMFHYHTYGKNEPHRILNEKYFYQF
jgi:hypothetical protein